MVDRKKEETERELKHKNDTWELEEYKVNNILIIRNPLMGKRKWNTNIARGVERATNHCQTREFY